MTGVYCVAGPAAALRLLRPHGVPVYRMRKSDVHVRRLSLAADDVPRVTDALFRPGFRQDHGHRPEVRLATERFVQRFRSAGERSLQREKNNKNR